ncbi:ATPase [Solibacillus sp. R5-41]|uniref:SRPBCC family protein n=1 Tax=Solibacillus sp. R5-41 TaxID=2048654 RepID=UPI000C126096|nr:SRPBCC domain-containing protein [Solibacillus sp. R5-41]ATP38911.1 ATPase [Solibacillus sp. R5-41]
MQNTSKTMLTMKRTFAVPAESVMNAWLSAQMIKKWLFTMEHTNKVATNEPVEGGTWEIVDHRGGIDYRAIGKYLTLDQPNLIRKTFRMPQFSETEDIITVELKNTENGSEMTFTQEITVPHEEGWSQDDIEKAEKEYVVSSEQGWHYMFEGLKQLVETGKINYPQ